MTKMIATKAMRYAGKSLSVGAEFSTKGTSHARLLQALGRAQPAPEVAAPPAAVLVAASKRVYKRKDMVAETTTAAADSYIASDAGAWPFPKSTDAPES
jgi:hypothetical protein